MILSDQNPLINRMAVVTYFSVSVCLSSVITIILSSVTGLNIGKRQIALIQHSFLYEHCKKVKVIFIATDSIKIIRQFRFSFTVHSLALFPSSSSFCFFIVTTIRCLVYSSNIHPPQHCFFQDFPFPGCVTGFVENIFLYIRYF